MIRPATPEDAALICAIYNHYILKTHVTFEEEPVSISDMAQHIRETTQTFPWLIWEEEAKILGFAYASKWKGRCAYRHSAESTVYLDHSATGKGLGTHLMTALLKHLRQQAIHTVLAGIALPNPASIALHEKLGFEKAAHLKQVGRKFDRWIDVGYWQLLFDE